MTQLAFIFPGQGSQKVGMLAELAADFAIIGETFAEASEQLGYDLWHLVQNGPQETLNLTERTQPMLLTASVAIWRSWQQQQGLSPHFMAGHSLGEWSALVCAGVVEFKEAVKAVQLRGKYMQDAVPAGTGTMAAIIGLENSIIIEACQQAAEDQEVSAVNFNAPGQVVIAGHTAAVERACELCKAKGAKRALPLAVSAPFHSTLLKPAADKLAEHLATVAFTAPAVPVIHNVNAKPETDPETIKSLMIEQIYHPVLWVDCVKQLLATGVTTTVECGPGKVLSGLNKRIDRRIQSLSLERPEDFSAAIAAFA